MCGITGFVDLNNSKNEDNLEEMISRIKHRGPNGQGKFISENLYFGHARLAIIDISENGHQPMLSACGRYSIIFNGEIYNHLDIRNKLHLLNKFVFKSTSDTETLLYGYIQYGKDILNQLNGIFSFAIFDKESKEIFIARDHFGVKPLYYYIDDGLFWFGSEIKSIIDLEFDRDISVEGFANYLTFLYSPGEKTAFKNVLKLLPGHYLCYNLNTPQILKKVKYYEIPFNNIRFNKSENELVDELEKLLIQAVERQMLSDVPVGFLLSGGIDSSALVAIAKKLFPNKIFDCYTALTNDGENFEEGFVNDLHYARLIAKHLNLNLIEVKAEVDIISQFDEMIFHLDEPQSDSAPLILSKICKRAKEDGNIVLIGGSAGDELFSGYKRHQALRLEYYFSKTPKIIRKLIRRVCQKLPFKSPIFRRLKKLTRDLDLSEEERILGYFTWIDKETLVNLFSEAHRETVKKYDPMTYFRQLLEIIPKDEEILNKMLFLEMRTFLIDHNLNYSDKMSMANGVELRVPYLDKDLLEFSTKIPVYLKLKGITTKYILKKVMEKYLPHEVIYRSKSGFGVPLRSWIANDLTGMINDYLSKDNIEKRGIFDYTAVRELLISNKLEQLDAGYIIWSLLAIESWMIQFGVAKS